MSKVFNMVGGGGKNISSIVITGLKSTDTVTCTKDGKTYPATWDDIAQHWEIVGLPLGTFTVTATNGTKTTTETVLIDIAGVYEIEMDYILKLYWYGDECEDITGGWSIGRSNSSMVATKENTYLYGQSKSSAGDSCYFSTVKKIDLSGYTKMCMITEAVSGTYPYNYRFNSLGFLSSNTDFFNAEHPENTASFYIQESRTYSLKTSKKELSTDKSLFAFYGVTQVNAKCYAIWLE